jgi:hypothetical protein
MPAEWRDFWALTKPRVMSLVVFTALCGLLAAPGNIHPIIAFTAVLCIALGAGACGSLNQWYEADVDAKMARTAQRPLPAGRMDREAALHFGMSTSDQDLIDRLYLLRCSFGAHPPATKWWDFAELYEEELDQVPNAALRFLNQMCRFEQTNRYVDPEPSAWGPWFDQHAELLLDSVWFHRLQVK